jgi:Domain of unknown function (DUF5668)
MTQWLLIRRLRGPAFLLLIGVMALLSEWADFSFSKSWPLLLILAGILSLAERAALSQADLENYDPMTGQPRSADTTGFYAPGGSPGSSIVPATPAPTPGSDPGAGRP